MDDRQLRVVVPDPDDRDIVQADAAGLLEEALDLRQRVEPSRRARLDLTALSQRLQRGDQEQQRKLAQHDLRRGDEQDEQKARAASTCRNLQ